ncbi:YceI family protein [Flaviaesturariibacter terrae]
MKTIATRRLLSRFLLLPLAVLLGMVPAGAQTVRKTGTYEITVNGTSNLHDWTMKSLGNGIEAVFYAPSAAKVATINPPMLFTMPVKNLKSNESMMDSRAYTALKADKFPALSFRLLAVTPGAVQGNRMPVRATGQLTIAGVTRDIVLNAMSVTNADGSVLITGSQPIRFSEYGLKPPSFMLGALRVGDELTINYTVRFQ